MSFNVVIVSPSSKVTDLQAICPEVYIPIPLEEESEAARLGCNWTKIISTGVLSMVGGVIASNPLTLSVGGVVHAVFGAFASGVANSLSGLPLWKDPKDTRIPVLEKKVSEVTEYLKEKDLIINQQNLEIVKLKQDLNQGNVAISELSKKVDSIVNKKIAKKRD